MGKGACRAFPWCGAFRPRWSVSTRQWKVPQGRSTLPHVTVDPSRVQDSGLLKDTIVLDIPDEATGDFDTVLVRRAADKVARIHRRNGRPMPPTGEWRTVLPLMVLQVPKHANPNDIGRALDTIFQQWPELPETSVAMCSANTRHRPSAGIPCPTSNRSACRMIPPSAS
jgi:type III restriction enzyme